MNIKSFTLATSILVISTSVTVTTNVFAATIYNGVSFPEGDISFADSVISYVPNSALGNNSNPASSLGAPDGTAFSLGINQSLVLKFDDNSLTTSNNSDYDLWIFEVGPLTELTSISISQDGFNWIGVGSTTSQTSGIDIDAYIGLGAVELGVSYSYVMITDNNNNSINNYQGADIDSVGAISSAAAVVPVPAAAWLFGSGIIGLLGVARHKKR